MSRSEDAPQQGDAPQHEPHAASFADRLRRTFGADVDPGVTLDGPPSGGASSELLRRLADHGVPASRYRVDGEIARGGMGAILRVWDADLRRSLAMKVMLAKPERGSDIEMSDVRALGRFLEEAQVTGQLDHPGIAPVHELGLDHEGRVFFTMKLVRGRDLKHVFQLVFQGAEGWNETRALSVILKVCEAMAYAHAKGVIHRDLKPANVMVGNFGEVYVMDWGLARVLGRKDRHDLRLQPNAEDTPTTVKTARAEERDVAPDSPLVTMDGDVVGTPAYMSPEQARGDIEKLSPRSDVYAIGTMLYHLLVHRMPYTVPGVRASNRTVLAMVLNGPPPRVHELQPSVPAELAAICEKAMARDAADRYADTLALAEDLRAYLEHRVVAAYETGALAELKKWISRNRGLAAATAAALVIALGGLGAVSYVQARGRRIADEAREVARANEVRAVAGETEAKRQESEAKRQEALARSTLEDVLALSAMQELADLEREADRLWPPLPALLPQYDAWLERAQLLVDGRAADPARGVERRFGLADHKAKLLEIRARGTTSAGATEFADARDRWWNAQLTKLVEGIEAFRDERTGLLSSGISPEHSWGVERRREFAATIAERSITGSDARQRWDDAARAIASSPKYGGLVLAPQFGLLPIGPDPASGLFEFAHLASGSPAQRDASGAIVRDEAMGIVLVLIPGGTFTMGAQSRDPSAPSYDADAESDETPNDVTLEPYFLSKYEMTQGQWLRMTGTNPSLYAPTNYQPRWNRANEAGSLLSPVEQVNWDLCTEVCARMQLVLPTEAQWENACRAGTTTPFASGESAASLASFANVVDRWAASHGGEGWTGVEAWDDGNTVTASVGSYAANAYGLHDMHGNVWEWCRDHFGDYTSPCAPGDGERLSTTTDGRVDRGGGYNNTAKNARSANRSADPPVAQDPVLGLRPARKIEKP